MLKIGDFSKLSRISIRMLRHYDEIGLLQPETVDTFTGYRYYSAGQLPLAGRIRLLRSMGFSLSAVHEIMHQCTDADSWRHYLQIKYAEVRQEAQETAERLQLLETAIHRLRKDESTMKYDVNVREMPQRYVVSLRRVIPAYDQEGILWQQMTAVSAPQNIKVANPCDSLAVFHDEGYKESDVDVEVQITVEGSYKNTENVVFKTVPPVLIASAVYKGSYNQLTEVNQTVAQWVTDNGYAFNGAMFCIYHVSPAAESNPDNLVTEVCFPVKKK